MSHKNNDRIYTAADIEKYHTGLLSAKKMHALEKAALDDPFLADALEGYDISGVNVNADITELKNRLAKRTIEENKVVPFASGKTTSFSWWKIAAMFLLIAGAGIIVYQFGFNNKSNDIAQSLQKEIAKPETQDSGKLNLFTPVDSGKNSNYIMPGQENELAKTEINKLSPDTSANEQVAKKNTKPKGIINETVAQADVSTVTNAPLAKQDENQNETLNKRSVAKEEESKAEKNNSEILAARSAKQKRTSAPVLSGESKVKIPQGMAMNRANIFRGMVTDANNNPLPFTNITNTEDKIGTYSDVKGNFILTSPDSVMNVQVSSIGFESNNVQLLNNVAGNKVLLQEDRSSLAEIVISSKKPNSNRARNNTMVLEEPEPVDGWSNYDIYLANNLKLPESIRDKQTGTSGEVELSFDITKEGEPVNITVKKSLCETCDKEAIRLVKEGPKWKRKTKKGKASVTVSF